MTYSRLLAVLFVVFLCLIAYSVVLAQGESTVYLPALQHGETAPSPEPSATPLPTAAPTSKPNSPPYTPNSPLPVSGAINQSLDTILSWQGGDPDGDVVTYDLFFGNTNPPPQVASGYAETIYSPAELEWETVYYWRVIASDENGQSVTGPIWHFTTEAAPRLLATTISTGASHTCAIARNGEPKCWGANRWGQLGNGVQEERRLTPVDVMGLDSEVTALAAGGGFTCALTSEGGVKCWGENGYGALGDGTRGDENYVRLTPVDVVGLEDGATELAAGWQHVCALTVNGGIKCWGWNYFGQLGDGGGGPDCEFTICRLSPVDVVGLDTEVVSIAASDGHTCALTSDGDVKCWGDNSAGQLGDGTTHWSSTPVDVVGLEDEVIDIALGQSHTCVLTSSGGVKCWGYGGNGQLGDGTTGDIYTELRLSPVNVIGLDNDIAAITAGRSHTCALTKDGGVKCWGSGLHGQLGDGTQGDERYMRLTPVDVVGLQSGVIAIDAGQKHTCALLSGGGIKCWGDNEYGQLGDGTIGGKYSRRLTPVDVILP